MLCEYTCENVITQEYSYLWALTETREHKVVLVSAYSRVRIRPNEYEREQYGLID